MKKLLILGAGMMQVPIIQKAASLGIHTIVADFNPNAPGIEYADRFLEISTIDKEAVLNAAKEEHIDGILTTSDYTTHIDTFFFFYIV